MENNKTRVINLSTEDINAYNIGEYYSYGNKWVNFGKNNDYPVFLRSLYLNSPTHQTICDHIVSYAAQPLHVVNPEQNPISNKFINENFDQKMIKNLIGDLKIYGYCAIQVYNGTKCLYSPAIKYCFDVKDENGNINYVWFSNNWEECQSKNNRPVKLPLYKEGSTEDLSIHIIQLDKKSFDYYSPVDYQGAINYINLEVEISKYHLSNIKNGLFPSFVISFIGQEFSDEQMNEIETKINKKFGGSGNTGRAIISFAPTKDDATQLTTIDQPQISEQYQFLSKECSEKILVGHGVVSPLLVGIRDTGGGLGSNTEEIQNAYFLYVENKIKPYQNLLIEGIKKIMNGNLLYADIEFINYNPFTNNQTKLSKIEHLSEVDSQEMLAEIDIIAIKPEGNLISSKIFNGKVQEGCYYKFNRSSSVNNIIIKKFEILDNKGYRFKPSNLIKNTNDYYFTEEIYFDKNK